DPKDFSRSEMRREMARGRLLEPLYRTAMALLPELGISNDSIAYYAALVDYYTVQKLQQLTQGMARLYLLCFLLQRYQRTNDNLINALIYQVRKVLSAAKVCLQERLLSDRCARSRMPTVANCESEPIRSNSSGANARGCWPAASSTTMPASYRNCSSAP